MRRLWCSFASPAAAPAAAGERLVAGPPLKADLRITEVAPRRVLVISGSVGAGHDGAARELADRLRRSGTGVKIRDFLDAVPSWLAWVLREG